MPIILAILAAVAVAGSFLGAEDRAYLYEQRPPLITEIDEERQVVEQFRQTVAERPVIPDAVAVDADVIRALYDEQQDTRLAAYNFIRSRSAR